MHLISVIGLVLIIHAAISSPVIPEAAMDNIAETNEKSIQKGQLDGVTDGDMKLTPDQMEGYDNEHGRIKRSLLKKSLNKRWPQNTLHFTILNGFSSQQKSTIRSAVQDIQSKTCIKFQEHFSNPPYAHVSVNSGTGCWSSVGRTGGKQELSLQSNSCVYKGTIMHEFIHALGVYHEQSRVDRDSYVTVNWGNIEEKLQHNFNKRTDTDSLGVKYDIRSIMHYGRYSFSTNNQMTVFYTKNPSQTLGGKELTDLDVEQLNLLYDCHKPTTTTTKTKQKTTTPSTPKSTSTATTTKKATPKKTTPLIPSICGDKHFLCIRAYHNKAKCQYRWYRENCSQSCGTCKGGTVIQCGNFPDNESYKCAEKAKSGYCITWNSFIRYNMKMSCTRTCCKARRIYF